MFLPHVPAGANGANGLPGQPGAPGKSVVGPPGYPLPLPRRALRYIPSASSCICMCLLIRRRSPAGPPGPPGAAAAPNSLPPAPPAPLSVCELAPDTERSSNAFTNPLNSRPTFVASPRPAASFDRASGEYLNYGPIAFSPGTTGVTFISAFSFTGSVGIWERVYDFGSGPGNKNFVLAREGTSNNLIMFFFIPNGAPIQMKLTGFIQQNQIIVSVVTYVVQMRSAFHLSNRLIMRHQVHPIRCQRSSEVVGQWPHRRRDRAPSGLAPHVHPRKHLPRPQQLGGPRRRFERQHLLLLRSQWRLNSPASRRQIQPAASHSRPSAHRVSRKQRSLPSCQGPLSRRRHVANFSAAGARKSLKFSAAHAPMFSVPLQLRHVLFNLTPSSPARCLTQLASMSP